ncbi:MAG: hypothetical protein KC657_28490 [Myxococcales bacterium]|nr:hypothetical protein [Myxococcales bacterium]
MNPYPYGPQPGFSPYAPPAPPYPQQAAGAFYRDVGASAPLAPLGSGARMVHVVASAIGTLGFFGAVGCITAAIIVDPDRPDETLMVAGGIGIAVAVLLAYVQIFAGLFWLYRAWQWLPMEQRYTKHWKSMITPGQAAWMMLIPYFHYYWMFVVNCGLCDALDRMRVQYPTRTILQAPKQLAIGACIAQLVIPVPVGAIMWSLFMRRVERMTAEMSGA